MTQKFRHSVSHIFLHWIPSVNICSYVENSLRIFKGPYPASLLFAPWNKFEFIVKLCIQDERKIANK